MSRATAAAGKEPDTFPDLGPVEDWPEDDPYLLHPSDEEEIRRRLEESKRTPGIPHEDMVMWVKSLYSDKPQPLPES